MISRELIVLISTSCVCYFGRVLEGTCLLPWDGVWYDSAFPKNNVTFDRSSQTVEGWKILVYNTEGTNWVCLEESGNQLLFKSTKNYGSTVFGLQYLHMYRCIQWSKLSEHVYKYYVFADEEPNAENQRLYADISNLNATISTACTPSGPPSLAEFHILVKADRESSAQQNCPSLFLHNFTYIHDNGVNESCDPANGSMDGCYNRSQIAFDFTKCNASVGFSTNGLHYCVHSETIRSVQYIITINPESVDYTTTFKFTCFVVQESGPYIYASDTKGSCKRAQSPFLKDGDGNAVLKMTYFDSCPFTQASSESDSGIDVVLIAAVVVGTVIILVTLSVIVVCCCCKKTIKRKLLCGHQTAMSKETDNEETLKEPIDPEKDNSTEIINPETYSTVETSSSSKNRSKQGEKLKLKATREMINEMEQPSSKLPFSRSGKQEKSKMKETREETGQEVDRHNTVEQCDIEKGIRKLEDGEELQRLGKVLFLEENEKFCVNDIAALKEKQESVQSKTMELRTTENVNHGDRAKSNENEIISGSQSIPKFGSVSSLSNNKQVETESSDKTICLKPIKTQHGSDENPVHLKKPTNIHRIGYGIHNNKAIQNLKSEKEHLEKVDLKKTNSHHTKSFTNGQVINESPENSPGRSQKTRLKAKKNDRKSQFMEDKAQDIQLNSENFKSSDSEISNNDKLRECFSGNKSDHNQTSVSNFHNSLSDYEQGPSETITVVIKKRKLQIDREKDDIKRDDKTTRKAEDVGRVGKKVNKSKKSADKLKKNNKKRQKLHCTNEISHADDGELLFMESSYKSDNLSLDREVNSVNENQPTAVQAWGQPEGDSRYPETFFNEDEESLNELSNTNDDDYVNMMKYDQILELRPKSSLAPVSTLMRNDASSPYLFQNFEIIRNTMDIDDNCLLPAIKLKGAKELENSTSFVKVNESLFSVQDLEMYM